MAPVTSLATLLVLAAAPRTGEERSRMERLEIALLAPCCYSEPVLRHRSDVALKMREEIAVWVTQGRSDQEILDHYKQLYGARVLMEPEGPLRWWMYVIPSVADGAGVLLTAALLRRWRAKANQAPCW